MFDTSDGDPTDPALMLPARVIAAVKAAQEPVVIPSNLDMAKLAREIVMERELPEVILRRYNLSDEQFAALAENPFYQRIFSEYSIEWQSATNTAQRAQLTALATIEAAMPVLGARMMERAEPFPAAIDAAKLFSKIAGLDTAGAQKAGPSEKFSIQINIGETKLAFEKNVEPSGSADTLKLIDATEKPS